MSPGPRRRVESPSQAPAFLQLSEVEVFKRFEDLDRQQRDRITKVLPSDRGPSPWARLSSDDVIERNRYQNIDPWTNNRVILRVPEGQCDYINASPIRLKGSRGEQTRRYIATQGPKESSSQHFWQMIWQETKSVGVVVMLTQTHEFGREKCWRYFPLDIEEGALQVKTTVGSKTAAANEPKDEAQDDSDSETYSSAKEEAVDAPSQADTGFKGRIELLNARYDDATRSTIRKLCLRVGEAQKVVWHYLFEGWPDFSIPGGEDRQALIKLAVESARAAEDAGNPRVVHCSAGVGRTGVFIALDHLLSELKDGALDDVPADSDPVAETVNELRKQRMMMVSAEVQFHFLYDFMKEQWLERHGVAAAAEQDKQEANGDSGTLHDGAKNGA